MVGNEESNIRILHQRLSRQTAESQSSELYLPMAQILDHRSDHARIQAEHAVIRQARRSKDWFSPAGGLALAGLASTGSTVSLPRPGV